MASLALPAYADRTRDYLRPMLGCGILTLTLTLALVGALAATSSLPVAVIALTALGGPAGVGISLLFAHLKESGAPPSQVVNTRAIVSVAWVAGPPVATLVIGAFGTRAVLLVIAAVAVLNIATTAVMLAERSATGRGGVERGSADGARQPVTKIGIALIVAAFVALQATNNAVIAVMGLFVTKRLGLAVIWAGIALGAAAGLEIPALLVMGRLSRRFSSLDLVASGCLAGIAYYTAMTYATGPLLLIGLQALNAWFVAAVSGAGLALFQLWVRLEPRPFRAGRKAVTQRDVSGFRCIP